MPLSALFLPSFLPPHSLTLSAQAGSRRTEMAFWVTQAGYAICSVNWWKRIEKEVETNDDGPAMIVPCSLSLSPAIFSPRGHWGPNNITTMQGVVEMFSPVLWFFFLYNYFTKDTVPVFRFPLLMNYLWEWVESWGDIVSQWSTTNRSTSQLLSVYTRFWVFCLIPLMGAFEFKWREKKS